MGPVAEGKLPIGFELNIVIGELVLNKTYPILDKPYTTYGQLCLTYA